MAKRGSPLPLIGMRYLRLVIPYLAAIGLAIAAELIRAHGGEIRLYETGPQGTAFHLTVPDTVIELRPGRRGERRRAGTG